MSEFKEKFSYSKLSTFETCGWRYKLQYIDKHFVDSSSIANEFGTLVHFIEETIAKDIIENNNEPYFMIDNSKYINLFINGTDEILGATQLKNKYPKEFYEKDKTGLDYADKANDYLNYGIFRLRDFLNENKQFVIVGAEIPFSFEYRDYKFNGVVDRILKNTETGELLIQDIKTWSKSDGHDLITPLQFVFYTLAVQQMYQIEDTSKIKCSYDLPLAKETVEAGTKGFVQRGLKKIDKLLDKIDSEDFKPAPSPLCHWCPFSKTFPNQPEEAKNLCPYYCKWTRENKNFSTEFEWMGIENHERILEEFIRPKIQHEIPVFTLEKDSRAFFIRR